MEELEGVHKTLNACGPDPSVGGSSSLLSLPGWALVQQNWSIGNSAERLEGRAGHTLGRMVPPPTPFYAAIL